MQISNAGISVKQESVRDESKGAYILIQGGT